MLTAFKNVKSPAEQARAGKQVGPGNIPRVIGTGDELLVSPPLNYFPLDHEAASHVLIAGGIGITPILAMMHDLIAKGSDFRLIYCTRSPETEGKS